MSSQELKIQADDICVMRETHKILYVDENIVRFHIIEEDVEESMNYKDYISLFRVLKRKKKVDKIW